MSGAVVRTCSPTDPQKQGHALVIVHYLDTKTNTRTFFIGEESSYKERTYKNSSGKNVTERMRRFPSSVKNNAGRNSHAKANADFVSGTNHFVVRKNVKKGNYKYTIQTPNGTWGFPKGSGAELDSKLIVIREFQEEVGFTLDSKRLVFKKCVEIARGRETNQSVVFHYELKNDAEVKSVKDAFTAQHSLGKGEIFNAGFFTEAEIKAKRKNKVSELAFADFATDHSANVDQTSIPRGGIVVPPTVTATATAATAATAAPAATAKYVPPHMRPGAVTAAAPSAKYVPPHKRTIGGRSRKRLTRKR